jgi:hypothetical protein
LPGHAREGIDGADASSGGKAGELASGLATELDRLIGSGQDREDHHGDREQRTQP